MSITDYLKYAYYFLGEFFSLLMWILQYSKFLAPGFTFNLFFNICALAFSNMASILRRYSNRKVEWFTSLHQWQRWNFCKSEYLCEIESSVWLIMYLSDNNRQLNMSQNMFFSSTYNVPSSPINATSAETHF